MIHYLTLKSREKTELIDITAQVEELLGNARVTSGCCDVFVMHTTAGITLDAALMPGICSGRAARSPEGMV